MSPALQKITVYLTSVQSWLNIAVSTQTNQKWFSSASVPPQNADSQYVNAGITATSFVTGLFSINIFIFIKHCRVSATMWMSNQFMRIRLIGSGIKPVTVERWLCCG